MTSLKQKILRMVDPWVRLPVATLDISDRSAKFLQFKPSSSFEFDFFGETELPENLISRGEIVQEEALSKHLKAWFDREAKQLYHSAVAVSLPEEKGFLRLIQIPKIKKEDIAKSIRWEIETNVPMPPDELIYDYEIIEPLEDHLDHFDILITAFPKIVIESYLRVLKKAGLNLFVLEHEAQAIVRAAIDNLKSKEAKIIADVGRTRTSFIIFAGGAINFTTTIDLGGKDLEDNIQRELKVTPEQAINVKKEVGLNKQGYEGKVFAALAPAISVLADELKRAASYFQSHTQHIHGANREVSSLLLTGGNSDLAGLDTYLSAALKLPVLNVKDHLVKLIWLNKSLVPSLPKNKLNAYTTAIGLALREG